jgi:hypothetical protein
LLEDERARRVPLRTAAREAAPPGVGTPHLVEVEEVLARILGVLPECWSGAHLFKL